MREILEAIISSPFQLVIITIAIVMLIIAFRQVFSTVEDSSKTQRQAKDELFKIFDTAIAKTDLFNVNYLRTVKSSIERKYEISFILNNLLEDYLVYVNSNKEKDDSKNIDTIYSTVKPIMDAENEEMPFEKLPENERRLLTNLKNNIENDDKQATSFNLNELCSVISLNNRSYLREKLLNRWSVPLAIFGLVFTLIFGITGLVANPNSDELNNSVSNIVDSKMDAIETKLEKVFKDLTLGAKDRNSNNHIDKTNPNKANSRAKINPKPWNWEKSHEIG